MLPFYLVAYFGGAILFIEEAKKNNYPPDDVFDLYTGLLLVSTIIFVIFFCIGFFHRSVCRRSFCRLLNYFDESIFDHIIKLSYPMAIITLLFFAIAFYGMGFIPALVENPFLAKYGAGEYHESYQLFAFFYRAALNMASVTMILLLLKLGFSNKRHITLLFLMLIFICLALSMRRSLAAAGLLSVFFSYMAMQSKMKCGLAVIAYTVIYCIGAAANDIFLYGLGLIDYIDLSAVFYGAPDVADQLLFLGEWVGGRWDYTYGLTWLGGLVPYNFDYNIAAYSLKVIGSQAGEVASGGFRLPLPIIGYISFDWIGVFVFVSLSSYLEGSALFATRETLQYASKKLFIMLNALFVPLVLVPFKMVVNGLFIDQLFVVVILFCLSILCKRKLKLLK